MNREGSDKPVHMQSCQGLPCLYRHDDDDDDKWADCNQRTSDSLNEGLPIKIARKMFHLKSTYLKIWVENPVFAIQHIENRKKFY